MDRCFGRGTRWEQMGGHTSPRLVGIEEGSIHGDVIGRAETWSTSVTEACREVMTRMLGNYSHRISSAYGFGYGGTAGDF